MLNMKILDYRITSDSNQVIVSRARRNEQGEITMLEEKDGTKKESLAVIGYYGNLSKALVAIQRDYVLSNGTEIRSIKTYKETLETITNKLENKINLEEKFE